MGLFRDISKGWKQLLHGEDKWKKKLQKRVAEVDEVDLDEPMPTPSDEDIRKSRRESLKRQRKRKGRASTVLTQDYLG